MPSLSLLLEDLIQKIAEDYLSLNDIRSLSYCSKNLNLLVKKMALNLFNGMKSHPYFCNQAENWGKRFGIASDNSILEKISKIFALFEKSIAIRKRDIDPTIHPRLELSSFRDTLHLDKTLRKRAFMEKIQSGVYTIRERLTDRDFCELNKFLDNVSQNQTPLSLNLLDQDKEILLFAASETNYWEAIPCLLNHHNINTLDSDHLPHLHMACFTDSIETIEIFLKNRVSVNVADKDGLTPLHLLAINNHFEAMNLLIDAGADINARNEDLCTPLHCAVEYECYESVFQLLRRGADHTLRTSKDLLPIDLTENAEIRDLLRSLQR